MNTDLTFTKLVTSKEIYFNHPNFKKDNSKLNIIVKLINHTGYTPVLEKAYMLEQQMSFIKYMLIRKCAYIADNFDHYFMGDEVSMNINNLVLTLTASKNTNNKSLVNIHHEFTITSGLMPQHSNIAHHKKFFETLAKVAGDRLISCLSAQNSIKPIDTSFASFDEDCSMCEEKAKEPVYLFEMGFENMRTFIKIIHGEKEELKPRALLLNEGIFPSQKLNDAIQGLMLSEDNMELVLEDAFVPSNMPHDKLQFLGLNDITKLIPNFVF